jgi:uncharacterized protein (DUF2147 family)
MKKFTILAALLIASTAAHAGNAISFDVNGKHVRVELPRNCDSLSCLKITAPGLSGSDFGFKSKRFDDDDNYADNSNTSAPAQNTVAAPAVAAPAPQPVAPVASSAPLAPTTTASTAPVAPAPVVNTAAPTAPAAPAPAPVPAAFAAAPSAPAPAPVAAAPAPAPTTPLGIWATEENKGNVRIEECGPNLCGYAVKTGEKILISMKPSGSTWTGQIHDPDSGSDYDSTIAMKGANALKVQGCAFGGMFCGGQTWKRVS